MNATRVSRAFSWIYSPEHVNDGNATSADTHRQFRPAESTYLHHVPNIAQSHGSHRGQGPERRKVIDQGISFEWTVRSSWSDVRHHHARCRFQRRGESAATPAKGTSSNACGMPLVCLHSRFWSLNVLADFSILSLPNNTSKSTTPDHTINKEILACNACIC